LQLCQYSVSPGLGGMRAALRSPSDCDGHRAGVWRPNKYFRPATPPPALESNFISLKSNGVIFKSTYAQLMQCFAIGACSKQQWQQHWQCRVSTAPDHLSDRTSTHK
jgi:hypothetical protein